ncbi:benzoylformate decarboxylase [Amycolatopsis acidiphila]|uniref:Benzoylformate decarboxylase n=1 Tax=Amycolatopsis acidiphila TaxID=715473 RepID=A0A558AG58_9PSEU|nr:benzoylformate decarboxylase [Amycolatopsis acidiphila]TVT23250.1 benzoylformate decarboxylase [Amycolatopsis acidiphila]UIJ56467.1 benzoylformate decarboxylase [Amycolatopsis acidiphila]GHG67095.1 benzoylformate decarboxylase [Amycolatopsis acidiphila]
MPTARRIAHEFLERQGLTTIFGNPGSNELPFLAELPGSFRYVLGLHEGVVVGMADGYAQATGRPVLVNLHAAAGSGNAMGALTNAVSSRSPLVLTAGQQVRSAIGLEAMLANVDATTLMRPLVGWSGEPSCAADVPRSLAQAVFEAGLQRRPTYLSVPYDDWSAELDANAAVTLDRSVQRGLVPDEQQLAAVTDALGTARNPVLVLGADLDTAGLFDRAVALAEHLDLPVWVAPSPHRLPFPNRHRLFRGVLPAGIEPVSSALTGHDLVLVLGAPVFRYHQHVPGPYLPAGTRLIQVTDDAGAAARAPMGEALVADPAPVLEALRTRLPARPGAADGPRFLANPEPATADGALHPEQVFAALRETQAADTCYVVESTSTNAAWWRQMDLRRAGSYFFPAAGGLGFGMPAAVGMAMGLPDRPVVAVIGDGSANYGITALWTAAQYRVPVTFVILRNGTYGALRWFGQVLGTPDVPGTEIPGLDFVPIAEGYGVPATTVTGAEDLRAQLKTASAGPRLIQVDTAATSPE